MKIKHLLLDIDGPVIDREKKMSEQIEKDYGIKNESMLPFFEGVFKECLVGKADLKKVLPSYLKQWGWKKGLEDFLKYWFECERQINSEMIAYIQDLEAKGIKSHGATNQEKYRTEYLKKDLNLGDVLDHFFSSADLGYKKPEQEFFAKMFDILSKEYSGLKKEEIIFWDDDLKNVKAGEDFGIRSFYYENFDGFEKIMRAEGKNDLI